MKKLIILLMFVFAFVYVLDSEGIYSMDEFMNQIDSFWESLKNLSEK